MSDITSSLLIRAVGSTEWSPPESASYANESELQSLLANDPTHLPGVSPGARAVQELPTAAGPIDICVVEPDGSVTVVECKLARNSEKLRMVIGQVIDYASSLRSGGIDAFRKAWSGRGGASLDGVLNEESAGALEDNLAHARIHLCLAVDQIDDDLRRLIEYLNLVSTDEVRVTALELAYARHGSVEILVPSIYGAAIAASKGAGRRRKEPWTWDAFLAELASEADRAIALDLRSRLEAVPAPVGARRFWFGNRPGGGIFFRIHGYRHCAFQLWQNSAHELLIYGNWTVWGAVEHHEGFRRLAEALGQSHLAGAESVPAREVDLDKFWTAAVECDRAINSSGPEPRGPGPRIEGETVV